MLAERDSTLAYNCELYLTSRRPAALRGAIWCLRVPDVALGRLVYSFNFVVIRSTASFTSPPALSIEALNCVHALSLAPFSL